MRQNPPQTSFSAGEISPLLYGRDDYQRVQAGLRQCRGFIPLRQGGVTRAPGTLYDGRTRGDAAGRLIPFTFAEDDAVNLEFTPLKMRVWRYGSLVLSGPDPYELTTPYDAASIPRLKFVQSADAIYLVDGLRPCQRLARSALASWSIADAVFESGPFELENDNEAVTIQASAETGTSITLTGVGSPFTAAHVGAVFQLRAIDDDTIKGWVPNKGVAPGQRRRYDGKIYEVVSGDDTGTNPPVHDEGTVHAGDGCPVWRYICDDIGIVKITAFANANSVTARVVRRIPPAIVAAPTHRWSEGAWCTKNGWPSVIAIHDQRLVLGATPRSPRTLWFSAIGDFREFRPGIEDDASFAYTIAGGGTVNRILWAQPGARGLHVGALGEEYSTRSTTQLQAIGPQTAAFGLDSTVGSAAAQPVAPDGQPMFLSRDKTRVFELRFQLQSDANTPLELSLPAEHLGADGFEEIAWQAAPLRLAWIRRGSGDIALLVHDPAEDVLGWAVLPLAGGVCESIAVSPDAFGGTDRVSMIVRRTIGGETRRHVERVALFYGVLSGIRPIAEAMHLFAARTKVGAPFTVVDNLGHLEGETVAVWTDRGAFPPAVVTGGQITLSQPVERATVGLEDATQMIELMDMPAQVREGSALGRQKRVKGFGLRFHRTAAAQMRVGERAFGRAPVWQSWADVAAMPVPSDLIEGHSGVVHASVPSGWSKEVTAQIRPLGGAPLTLLGATPLIEAAGG